MEGRRYLLLLAGRHALPQPLPLALQQRELRHPLLLLSFRGERGGGDDCSLGTKMEGGYSFWGGVVLRVPAWEREKKDACMVGCGGRKKLKA